MENEEVKTVEAVEAVEEVAETAETPAEEKKPAKPVKTEKSTVKTYTVPEKTSGRKGGNDKRKPKAPETRREDSEFDKKLVEVRRVAKVVKGGRTMRFSALVVVGNKNGLVGLGIGKSGEVSEAVEKATANAKKNLISVPIVGTTIPHEIVGKFGASSVHMFPAPQGTGVIAGGSARAVVELAGIKDIVTKAHGSNNKINGVRATIEGLKLLRTREEVAALRGKTPEEI